MAFGVASTSPKPGLFLCCTFQPPHREQDHDGSDGQKEKSVGELRVVADGEYGTVEPNLSAAQIINDDTWPHRVPSTPLCDTMWV